MKIIALNLLHGGGARLDRLADFLCAAGADVVVASEYLCGERGDALKAGLSTGGFACFHHPPGVGEGNTVLLATRNPSRGVRADTAPCDRNRIVLAEIEGLTLAGVYFNQGRDKASLFDFLLSRPRSLGESCLVIGDMNTGLHNIDEPGATFACSDRFALMEQRGYVDLWRRCHGPNAREVSWISPRGVGYRIDHAFASEPVAARVGRCEYDHSSRGDLTDHSALIVELSA